MRSSEPFRLPGVAPAVSLSRRRWLLGSIGAILSLPGCGTQAYLYPAGPDEPVHDRLRGLSDDWVLPPAQIAWRPGFGLPVEYLALPGTGSGDTPAMRRELAYPVASVGKVFLGLLVRRLVDERAVDPDAPLSAWLSPPWSALAGDRTTWRQLARHQAGLPEPIADGAFQAAVASEPARRWTVAELAEVGLRMGRRPLVDGGFRYSNLHSVVLARAAETLAGKPLHYLALPGSDTTLSALAQDWQQPASLAWRDTGLRVWRHAREGRPIGYGRLLTDVTAYNPSWAGEGGDWSATIDGLIGLGDLLATLGRTWQDDADEWVRGAPRLGESYGWHLMRRRAWIGHTGDVPGFSCALWARPQDGAVVVAMVALSNTRDGQQPADALTQLVSANLGDQ